VATQTECLTTVMSRLRVRRPSLLSRLSVGNILDGYLLESFIRVVRPRDGPSFQTSGMIWYCQGQITGEWASHNPSPRAPLTLRHGMIIQPKLVAGQFDEATVLLVLIFLDRAQLREVKRRRGLFFLWRSRRDHLGASGARP
jgi:hypothetical protein